MIKVKLRPKEEIIDGTRFILGIIAVYVFGIAQIYHWEAQGMPMVASGITAMINTIPMMLLMITMEGEGE